MQTNSLQAPPRKSDRRPQPVAGKPIRGRMLPYGAQAVTDEDIRAVVEVLRSARITTGPKVEEFEQAVADVVGSRHAVAFSSGTAALHAAAFAAGIGPGDEAVTTPLTFCATANCILYQGGRPVFADVEDETLTLDPREAARQVTSRTKAVLPVDYAGHPADLNAMLELADRHGLVVIEDACHALGAVLKRRHIGSISHMTVFSFHPVKHITTGEGGMVTTNSVAFARRLQKFRNHGIEADFTLREASRPWYYEMTALGYNYRLPDIGCALGLSQLKRLDSNVARRQEIAARYTEAFRKLPGVRVPAVQPGVHHAWHLYPIRLELERFRADRGQVLRALRTEGLGVTVHFIPVHRHPYYRSRFGYRGGEYPVAEQAYEQLISLPMFPAMSERDIRDVIQAVTKVLSTYAR